MIAALTNLQQAAYDAANAHVAAVKPIFVQTKASFLFIYLSKNFLKLLKFCKTSKSFLLISISSLEFDVFLIL
ncbi:hypothetical protein JIY74_25530 [Vibrio harveyi]|nr:hypothetical protein [Vibrio harveyi]